MFRSNNPTLKEKVFRSQSQAGLAQGEMTLNGTVGKTGILLLLLIATATIGWASANPVLAIGGLLLGFGLAMVICFNPSFAPVGAPIYALLEGLAVGAISRWYNESYAKGQYTGMVPIAVMGTLFTLGVMLALYRSRVIRVTETFRMVIIGATAAIAVTYLATILLSLFGASVWNMPIYQASPIGIAFSAFVIVIAALNLCLDFNTIEAGIEARAPKYMEWYAGFGLLVTLVWLYLEILRLLSKLSRR
jgi:uncharacterized YccA/Bax inhibitor family protein